MSAGSALVEGTGSELFSWLQKRKKKGQCFLHCILWHDAERQNAVRYAARNWRTSSTHPSQAAVKINKFFQWTSHFSVRETETAQKRDCLKPLSKTHFVTQICTVLPIISAWGLSSCMRGVYVALKLQFFCLFAAEKLYFFCVFWCDQIQGLFCYHLQTLLHAYDAVLGVAIYSREINDVHPYFKNLHCLLQLRSNCGYLYTHGHNYEHDTLSTSPLFQGDNWSISCP